MSENLKLWDAVVKTDPAHTKAIEGKGYKGTSIKPMYTFKKATEQFGPIGIGWGFKELDRVVIGETLFLKAGVWFEWNGKRGEIEQWGGDVIARSNGKANDEAFKMALTDAVTKCLSYLGFGADVHLGQFDDSKYVRALVAEFAELGEKLPGETSKARNERYLVIMSALKAAETETELKQTWSFHNLEIKGFGEDLADQLAQVKDRRKTELLAKSGYPKEFNEIK